jgi:cyclohexa-1,5-dienecarbonyl-CoA hydratase
VAAGAEERGAILTQATGRTGTLTLNRPPLNILDIAAFRELGEALTRLLAQGCDILVLRAAGTRAFCAGADVADHRPERAPAMLEAFHAVARQLTSADAVSVAAVEGLALGGGMELALCCDLVVASEQAEFGQPEIHVGSFPPIAAAVLPGRIGRPRAADLILTGRRVTAYEALALGLVSRLAPADAFEAELRQVVESLETASPSVMRQALRALRGRSAPAFAESLAATEKIYLEQLLQLEDAREGVEAFMTKRRPSWTGR